MSATNNRDRVKQVAILVIRLLCHTCFFPRWPDPSKNLRPDVVVAAVEDGVFKIDKYVSNTVDYA